MHPNPQSPDKTAVILAVGLGIIAGAVDLLARSPQIATTLIVIFAFMLSLTYPLRAWLWAILVAMFVPLFNLLAVEFGLDYLRRPENVYLAYFAFVPAFIGAYSANFLRRYSAKQEQKRREAE